MDQSTVRTTEKQTLPTTKQVKDGKLSLAKMELGHTIVGILKAATKNTFGDPILVLETEEFGTIDVRVAGNVKTLFFKDVETGRRPLNTRVGFSRVADKTTPSGRRMTQFSYFQEGVSNQSVREKANTTRTTSNVVAPTLDEIRARLNTAK